MWRKLGGKASLRLATFPLRPADHSAVQADIIDHLLLSNKSNETKLKDHVLELERTKTELEKARALNERLVCAQMEAQSAMISQFLPLLNAKKRKCRELEAELLEKTR